MAVNLSRRVQPVHDRRIEQMNRARAAPAHWQKQSLAAYPVTRHAVAASPGLNVRDVVGADEQAAITY